MSDEIDNLLDGDDDDEENGDGGEPQEPREHVPGSPKKRIPKPRLKKLGLGAPEEIPFKYQEAELLWVEILDRMPRWGKSAFDLGCRVSRLAPDKMQLGNAFSCEAIVGDDGKSPGDALIDFVSDNYHLASGQQGPMRYELLFFWKAGGKYVTKGILSLPSAAEIMAFRRARMMSSMKNQPAAGVGAPPAMMPQMPAQPSFSPAYYPHPHQQPPMAPDFSAVMNELAYTRGALNEALAASREGRQPNIPPPPPGVGAPPAPQGMTKKEVVEAVVEVLKATGLLPAAAGVGAPPPTPPAAAQEATSVVSSFGTFVKQMQEFKRLGSEMRHVFEPDEEDEEPPPAAAPPPPVVPEKDDGLPFIVSEVPGSKWPDGTSVQIAMNKESRDVDKFGLAMANPYVAGKAMDALGKLAETASAALAKFGGFQQQQGVGAPPPPQEPKKELPPSPPNGAAEAPTETI